LGKKDHDDEEDISEIEGSQNFDENHNVLKV